MSFQICLDIPAWRLKNSIIGNLKSAARETHARRKYLVRELFKYAGYLSRIRSKGLPSQRGFYLAIAINFDVSFDYWARRELIVARIEYLRSFLAPRRGCRSSPWFHFIFCCSLLVSCFYQLYRISESWRYKSYLNLATGIYRIPFHVYLWIEIVASNIIIQLNRFATFCR